MRSHASRVYVVFAALLPLSCATAHQEPTVITAPIEPVAHGTTPSEPTEPAASDESVTAAPEASAAHEDDASIGRTDLSDAPTPPTGSAGGAGSASSYEDAAPPPKGDVAYAPAPRERSKTAKSAPGRSVRSEAKEPSTREYEKRGDSIAPMAGSGGGAGSASSYPARAIAAPTMTAGRHDDNKQYNRFLTFLAENAGLVVYPVDIGERLLIRVRDRNGKSLPNCAVNVRTVKGQDLAQLTTYADGSTQFFPTAASATDAKEYTIEARCPMGKRSGQLSRTGARTSELSFPDARVIPARVPVDIAIVIDTTGSMGGQIGRLKETLQAIHFQLTQLSTRPDIRFGLVAYRDRGDDYVTRVTAFTDDVNAFQKAVDNLDADGGGDTPEDLQTALDDAMHKLQWRPDALRLGFAVADAVPHTDYGQTYTYRDAMKEALSRGIKWTTVGAGGLGRNGEVIFRQIAQFTMGEYVFVTQGGGGDSEGGAGEASHHIGSNYKTENLDQAIIRIVRRELSYLTDEPKDFDDTIVAQADKPVARDQILAPAVAEALRQLVDYSSLRLAPKTPVAIAPVTTKNKELAEVAEYLAEQMTLVASRTESFKVVERDLTALSQELKVQLSDLFDVEKSVPIGKMLGADVLVVAKLTARADGADLFARLVRVETGEILSVAKVSFTSGAIASR